MKPLFRKRNSCRLCAANAVEIAVPLVPMPVATPNIGLDVAGESPVGVGVAVPMDLHLCHACGHLQILDVIDPDVQYTNFKYVTSISLGLPEHFRKLAEELSRSIGAAPGSLVVEIGSNDGTLLRAFTECGFKVLGIDPARETARRATESGIETLATFFTGKLADEIVQKHSRAAIIVANNTFANIDDLADVARGIKHLLAPEGVFVFETSYGADVIEKFLLDTVYHEHLSYFMVRPLVEFFDRHGMELYDVQHIWTKGGSIRGFVQLSGGKRPIASSVAEMIAHERQLNLHNMEPYGRFAQHVDRTRAEIGCIIDDHRAQGLKIAGYGASVGTVTLLQQFGLGSALDFIADDNPLTDVIMGPDYRVPVLLPGALDVRNPAVVVILAWRYAEAIRTKNAGYEQRGGRFLVPLPELKFL
jgi:SAM-dependent methyltransferase